ncbi:saccharopine dehydrogenase NADP-binding domain-containing protein [Prosthecochloris sp. SCSIO W1101]|uniref:saccharopine dehydrogenase family protein n=1 Tax=Prosthecochloris sp. SCSIO W1101 TaxID=2992242 RepID=UPI00223E86C5|nr:saccharopine dehydrogenase NADP-binding domain-containing protein [Prosthecochloris sp. SCSIO W1101]UZJ40707.1 saccharopine dehydrogenase NADP-binding domain-containing protein [Prosthecochloris sp. SCSIO W1101]
MSEKKIGIVGGYGRVGEETARHLIAQTGYEVVVAGRDPKKAYEAAEMLGERRVSGEAMDINDRDMLDAFCRRCDLVINCAGPSWCIMDRIAAAALRQGIHYVDPGGYEPLVDALSGEQKRLEEKGLVFIAAAGLLPGMSGLFPSYVVQSCFERVDSLEVYYVGHDKWTFNSAYDIASSLDGSDSWETAYYENGETKKAGPFSMSKKTALPAPIGTIRSYLMFTEELKKVVEANGVKRAHAYGTNSGRRMPMVMASIKLFKQSRTHEQRQRSAKRIVRAAEKDLREKDPCFMVHVVAEGEEKGGRKKLAATLSFQDTYKPTGIVAANAARFVLENKVNGGGLFLLPESVDVKDFMSLLEKESFHFNISEIS